MARAIHLIGIGLLAMAVLAQPAAAVPRVTCAPKAVCGPADEPIVATPQSDRHHGCCPVERPTVPLEVAPSEAESIDVGGCCLLTAGVPADLWTASASDVVPAPAIDLVAELPADPVRLPPSLASIGGAIDDRPWLLPWQKRPEQGAGPRPPPSA